MDNPWPPLDANCHLSTIARRARVVSQSMPTIDSMDQPRIRVELYAFSYFDSVRKRWLRARYRATIEDIKSRHSQYKLEGPPEVREGPRDPRIISGNH